MNPQGTGVIDTGYFNATLSAVNGASSCQELQAIAKHAMASFAAFESSIATQLALIAPMLQLLTAPTSPNAVVTWVQTFITVYLAPQLTAATTYTAKTTALLAQVAAITEAIVAKAKQFTSCVVSVQSVGGGGTIPILPPIGGGGSASGGTVGVAQTSMLISLRT
jgi:hypothetical protein